VWIRGDYTQRKSENQPLTEVAGAPALEDGWTESPEGPRGATSITLHGDADLIALQIGADLAWCGLMTPAFLADVVTF